jgi:hypothetical protein
MTLSVMEGFTFGCDPELFVQDSKGRFVSAEGLIPGTKAEPHAVEGGAVQVDGMAAEFNIDPVSNYSDFRKNINGVRRQLQDMLPSGHTLAVAPSVVFDEDIWDASPEQAKELGCSPDFNAWTGDVNPPPQSESNPRLRTASGHLHIGWTNDADENDTEHMNNCMDLIKQLDWYLGAWSLRLDKDTTRRELYGKAGACRIKPYGTEYRVLSNFWLLNDSRMETTWNRMQMAIHDMRRNFMPESGRAFKYNNLLIESINTSARSTTLERSFKYPITTIS